MPRNGMEVAEEIVRQLGGSSRMAAMIGAKNFIGYAGDGVEQPGVCFRHMAGTDGANFTRVLLDRGTDTYTVEVGRVRSGTCKILHTVPLVYNDALRSVFEARTGLYLNL